MNDWVYPIPHDVPDELRNQNLYFYYGWESHAAGNPIERRAVTDHQSGWTERQKLFPHPETLKWINLGYVETIYGWMKEKEWESYKGNSRDITREVS